MRIALLQTCIADYRDHFIRLALVCPDVDLKIFVGEEYFEASTRTSAFVLKNKATTRITNFFIFNRRLCFQNIPFRELIKSDVVVFELNPRLISNWPLLLIRKLLGKRNVLWGHAWSRSGPDSRTEVFRHMMRQLADGLIFYTQDQLKQFNQRYSDFIGKNLTVAPNSLYPLEDIESVQGDRDCFVYVGRLVKTKKVELLVRAFATACDSFNEKCSLIIVGDGPERDFLQSLAENLGVVDRIEFKGHVSDLGQLKQLYSRSLMSVSPGYVGLSITQSFAFGVPMIVAESEPHSPEIEAFIEGDNGLFFKSDSVEDLEEKLRLVYHNAQAWKSKASGIAKDCRMRYSVEKMVEGFYAACRP